MKRKKELDIYNGSINSLLFRLAIPTMAGMLTYNIYNLVDTYYISKLGINELAAMGITFPVVMMIGAVGSGISIGAGSILSRAKGEGNTHKIQRIASDGILLALLLVTIISIIGMLTRDPLFSLLGADESTLPLVKQYMDIWYLSAIVIVAPRVIDGCMRASGDMIRPLIGMLVGACLNIILDPIFIFGFWFIPALGIKGAIIATVIAKSIATVVVVYFSWFHHKFYNYRYKNFSELLTSWKDILNIGIPNITIGIMPHVLRFAITSVTGMIAGKAALAALGAGSKIESFSVLGMMGFGAALIPLMGQNWGAGNFDRVETARKKAINFGIIYGIVGFIIMLLAGEFFAKIFVGRADAILYTKQYLTLMLIGSIGANMTYFMCSSFSTTGRPMYTLGINVIGTMLVIIPMLYLGSIIYGYVGMLIGVALGQLIVGFISVMIASKYLIPYKLTPQLEL